ncbi:MAG: hypothetical protein Q4G59_09740 [Planctomycetia bacterium]|nr:hypothetical protein [Planctomycetia bacterium]
MNYVLYFFMGGTLMALLKLVSQRSESFAGILGALPVFSGVFLLMNMLNSSKSIADILAQSRGSVFGMVVGTVFYLAVCVAIHYRMRSVEAFGVAALLSLFIVVVSLTVKEWVM